MSDYSFMKSGVNNLEENEANTEKEIVAVILHFMENATRSASIFVDHSKRNAITVEDVKRGLMLEIFLFSKRVDIKQDIIRIKNELDDEDEDDESNEDDDNNEGDESNEDDSDYICPDDEVMEFKESLCECAMCKCLNNVYDRWGKWTPISPIEIIMKKHIEKM